MSLWCRAAEETAAEARPGGQERSSPITSLARGAACTVVMSVSVIHFSNFKQLIQVLNLKRFLIQI
jgi:hypothetical protein